MSITSVKVGIINYGMGNIHSLLSAIKSITEKVEVAENPEDISKYSHIILPGVGHFSKAMKNIVDFNFLDPINEASKTKNILGICLGMQLLGSYSEEGDVKGLGLVSNKIVSFQNRINEKIPHVGFNTCKKIRSDNFFKEITESSYLYHVHSYFMETEFSDFDDYLICRYGIDFITAFKKGNIIGTQFHPELSQSEGLKVLKNFLKY